MNRRSPPVLALLVMIALTGCSDAVAPNAGVMRSSESFSGLEDVPARGAMGRDTWMERSDSALWRVGAEHGFIVGLKAPGRPRGVWRDRILLTPGEWKAALRSLSAASGITLVRADTILPNASVTIANEAALRHLRRLPFIDYVEPNRPFAPAAVGAEAIDGMVAFSGGGGSGSGAGCSSPPAYSHFYGTAPAGDWISWSYAPRYNNVVEAWRRSQGDGVRIAVLDTGVDLEQPQLMSRFTEAPHGSRSIWYEYTAPASLGPGWRDECGHGTRMAGVIAAPMDGLSIVGIAYMSDLIAIRVGANVMPTQEALYAAIHKAMEPARPAHIIVMSVATDDDRSQITDAIRYYWYRTDGTGRRNGPIFIAAAGTNSSIWPNWNVVYPAELPEVIAVSAVDSTWTFDPESHYGAEVELSGFRPNATVGTPGVHASSPHVTSISGASTATASVAGIAALAWARYPSMQNWQLRHHLFANATRYPYRNDKHGYGTLHAYKAVGGFVGALISGPGTVPPHSTHTYTAVAYGDGPFAYQWSNGATTPSTAYSFGQYGAWISVVVTDLYEGRSREIQNRIEVDNGSWNPTPCDPNLDPMCPT